MSGYELVIPLALVPATFAESSILAILSWGLAAVIAHGNGYPDLMSGFRVAGTWSVVFVLLPCLALVLRRPNVGTVPAWVERFLARTRIPTWLAGTPAVVHIPQTDP
jgi:hypothetical protein